MIVGVTGFFAAGKDTVAEILMDCGFEHVSLSNIIRDEIRARGEEINIPNLTRTGNELRACYGPGVLADRAIDLLPTETDAVVTSIRHTVEVEELRERSDFTFVFVDAPIRVRYERSSTRARSGDPVTFEEFEAAEREQMESNDPNAQQLALCRDKADFVIVNDGTLDDLREKVASVLDQVRETQGA